MLHSLHNRCSGPIRELVDYVLAACFALMLSLLSASVAYAEGTDHGDAPASYGIASHAITSDAPYLGKNPADEDNGDTSDSALADDNSSDRDDEDGVYAFPVLVQNTKAYTVNVFASNPCKQTATLIGWVDFNGNGIFEPFESAKAALPAGSDHVKIKLLWNNLKGVSTDYTGTSYARFRISTDPIDISSASGFLNDGEVEDYRLTIQSDVDGDELADSEDPDNDNDSIPDVVEGVLVDSDGDGLANYLDTDSDGDGISDLLEAGGNGLQPVDSDGDGTADYLDLDSDNDGSPDELFVIGDVDGDGINGDVEGMIDSDRDGLLNPEDLDSDNDSIPDAIESSVDTDGDLIPDFLDLDSDNDGLSDLYESGIDKTLVAILDADGNGRIDPEHATGQNGLVDSLETAPDSGLVSYVLADTDQDGIRDAIDADSDNDGVSDLLETGGIDINNDGQLDSLIDSDHDNIPDTADVDVLGGQDVDNDGIADAADADFQDDIDDSDLDGIIDTYDPDSDGNGIVDEVATAETANGDHSDTNNNGVDDFLDDQAAGSGGAGAGGGLIETGLAGYPGCSLLAGGDSGFDPLLLILLLGSLLGVALRRTGGASHGA